MTITTPSHNRASGTSLNGEIPAQRTVLPARARAVTATAPPEFVAVPARGVVAVSSRATAERLMRIVVAMPAADTATPAPAVAPIPQQAIPTVPAQVTPALPVRVTPTPARTQPTRRRWPAAVGGLAAGLTLGTVGAVGAAFALTMTAAAPAPAARVVTASPASLSPNVSVPGRVLTAFGDGTWQVGVDVVPGTYMSTGAVDGTACRHALRSTRTGGDVAARVGSGLDTVVLTGDDTWFATSGCATWNRVG